MHRDGQTTFEHRGLNPQPPVTRWLLRRQPEHVPAQASSLPRKSGGEREHDAAVRRWLLRMVRGLELVHPQHQPWRVAVAVAAGISVGLLPPASLLFMMALLAICLMPIHRGAAISVALGIAVSLPDLTAILDQVGWYSLTHPATESLWLRIERLPWTPWLSLNHTVINGGLILACAAFLPCLAVALLLAWRLDAWANRASTLNVPCRLSSCILNNPDEFAVDEPPMASSKSTDARSLTALHAGVKEFFLEQEGIPEERRMASQGPLRQEFPVAPPPAPPVVKSVVPTEGVPTETETPPSLEPEASIERLEVLLERGEVEHQRVLDPREVLERAAEMTSLIDDILAQYEPPPAAAEHLDQEDATREIIRHDPQASFSPPPLPTPPLNNLQTGDPSSGPPQRSGSSAVSPSADASVACSDEASPRQALPLTETTITHGAHASTSQCDLGLAAIEEDAEASTQAIPLAMMQVPPNSTEQRDEALHHLLTHLRELKEKA